MKTVRNAEFEFGEQGAPKVDSTWKNLKGRFNAYRISGLLLLVVLCIVLAMVSRATSQEYSPSSSDSAASRHAATGAPGRAQPTAPPLDRADLESWLDGMIPAALQQGKVAGAVVSVVKDGHVILAKGYGSANVAAKTPMDADRTLMRIGSTSKLLTWTAVMQLVEAGKIDLNADVNRYLDFKVTPKVGRPITMTDLMTHRGGLEEGLKDLLATDPALLKTTERYLKENTRPSLLPAGVAPAYSNYGAALAGYIVQRVSGEPFEAYVARHILAPLKMGRTTFVQPLPPALAAAVSKGYRQSDGPATKFELAATAPAGSASSTASDMANFMIAHLQQGRFEETQILRPETARLMHTPSLKGPTGFDTLAHGFFYSIRNDTVVIGHGGDTMVFHSDLNLLPEKGVGIFVSFNSRGENDAVYGIRSRLLNLFLDRYFPVPKKTTPPAIAGAARDAQAIQGHYESSRRVETGFISLFYLLQQDKLTANGDGTVSLSSAGDKRFREIAPSLWQDVASSHRLLVTSIGGRRAIVDSTNPIQILQIVPFYRNATVFQLIVAGSLLILLATVLVWPIAAWVRRKYKLPPLATGKRALTRRSVRIAALADLAYFFGWYSVLSPILRIEVDGYNKTLDGTLRFLQVASIIPIAGALIGIWNVWLAFRAPLDWAARLRSVIVALALIGFLWMAWLGNLIDWSLNY
jgi:CubicO group peptidase (beta-lactamase class C family)